MESPLNISHVIQPSKYRFEFSICTLVTNAAEYEEMLTSFLNKGFDTETCEYLRIDNINSCSFDAYSGLNQFLRQAQGRYIIVCHQDIIVHDHNKEFLLARINEIESLDKNWAILANAGGINFKWIATNLTQGTGRRIYEKRLPLLTKTVDENFIIVKNSANLSCSNNLSGFHMYGTDICLIADIIGFNSYVIDFNVTHKSDGKVDESFYRSRTALINKYNYALRGRFMSTTITRFYLSGNWLFAILFNFQPVKFLVRQYYKLFYHKKRYVPKR